MNVCGDWYDIVDLVGGHRMGVAVGDVVGHGLEAAGVMGRLRSALSAISRVAAGPAEALNILGRYAHVVDGAESATVVTAFIGFDDHTITYSSTGHPPPVLVQPDGRVEFLDQATDPPFDARPDPIPRPQARTGHAEGATLVLYTDGLIERRGEDIDTGPARLADSLDRHRHLGEDPEALADAVLLELLPPAVRQLMPLIPLMPPESPESLVPPAPRSFFISLISAFCALTTASARALAGPYAPLAFSVPAICTAPW